MMENGEFFLKTRVVAFGVDWRNPRLTVGNTEVMNRTVFAQLSKKC